MWFCARRGNTSSFRVVGSDSLKVGAMSFLTEDEVRDRAKEILGLETARNAKAGVGQLTTFAQLGFAEHDDRSCRPDGWYLPDNRQDTALILEVKNSKSSVDSQKSVLELLRNVAVAQSRYDHVVGILWNGERARVFMGQSEVDDIIDLVNKEHYLALYESSHVDKERIYELTARINNCLHVEFGIKNLYHRMIFTACALVAKRFDAYMHPGMNYQLFSTAISDTLERSLARDGEKNQKLKLLLDVFGDIKMNLKVDSTNEKDQERVIELIGNFIKWIEEISRCINSGAWRGEDVMGIFFNEFNRYRKKAEAGQVFTPEHITDFMYHLIGVTRDDLVLDACCGSGGFLVKAMANMVFEAGGPQSTGADSIKQNQLFGMENDREIYALACANMLIHKDGKTNLVDMDARSEEAKAWIASRCIETGEFDANGEPIKRYISKVLMNPPFETTYGCMTIVENVLDSVPRHTDCAFILPDKKLEKMSKNARKRLLEHHRLMKVVKLPKGLFQGVGVTTSIFVFESGVPQGSRPFFACYMESDGLETIKNKGRHDVFDRWPATMEKWLEITHTMRGHETCQWNDPSVCLSYQEPPIAFEVEESDFLKVAMEYVMYEQGVDSGDFASRAYDAIMYKAPICSEQSDEFCDCE